MREILFRGKRVDNGEWVQGYLSFHYVDGKNKDGFVYSGRSQIYVQSDCKRYDVITETVGQYTGLTDKNGNKIFEGDVAVCQGGEYYHGTWEYESTEIVKDMRSMGFLEYCEKAIVIGNIHDKEEEND